MSVGDVSVSPLFAPQEQDQDCSQVVYPWNSVGNPNPSGWSSMNESVAKVGPDGTVTAVGPGTATIMYTWQVTIYECGNGCQTTTAFPVAAGIVSVVDVKFKKSDGSGSDLPSPFKVGISQMTIGNTDVAGGGGPTMHDRTQTIWVVVTPAGEAANVTVSGPGLNVSTVSTNTTSGVITVKVVGKTKSTQRGDFSLYANHTTAGLFPKGPGGTPLPGGFPVTVVVPGAIAGPPNYQHDTTGTLAVQNMALNLTTSPTKNIDSGHVELDTIYARFLTITVLDQFGDPLGNLYQNAEVEENIFGTLVSINSPLSATGTYSDPVGAVLHGNKVAKGDPSIADWLKPDAAKLPLMADSEPQTIAVSVDQFALTPSVAGRTWTATPPNSITISWP
jgi:hypothetical protein